MKTAYWVAFYFCLLLCVNVAWSQSGENEHLHFIDNDLAQAQQKAQELDRIIFVDAYTTWCAPCRMMDQEVFTDSMVISFFSDRFVNLKMDMEEGEGQVLAKKHQVNAYPTFLFLNAEGVLLHRGLGFLEPNELVRLAQKALDPDQRIENLQKAYRRGNRSEETLYHYASALADIQDPMFEEVAKEYLEQQDNWAQPRAMSLILRLAKDYQDPYYNFIVERKYLFLKEYGEGATYGTLMNILEKHFLYEAEHTDLKEVQTVISDIFPASKAGPFYDAFELDYYHQNGKPEEYLEKARQYVRSYPNLSWNALNELAWNVYESYDLPKLVKQAVKWAKKSINLQSNHFNNDTLAALYYKQGNKKKALRYANKAIALAKEAGYDFSATQELKEKIMALSD